MKFDKKFKLFSSCLPIKGYRRSGIYDIQRMGFDYIPNDLYTILKEYDNHTINEVIEKHGQNKENKEIIIEYFDFLYKNEMIFFSELDKIRFPKYNYDINSPYHIGTLVLDICKESINQYLLLLKEKTFDTVFTEMILVRFIDVDLSIIFEVLDILNDTQARTLDVYIRNITIEDQIIEELFERNNRIYNIHYWNCIINPEKQKTKKGAFRKLENDILSDKLTIKGFKDFFVNTGLFIESQSINNFFYRRVYINSKGEIGRHEFDNLSFGNINRNNLLDIIEQEEFKKYWLIKKDDIAICKDCEYRYMCVDNRLPLYKNDENLWVLEGTCNYDPYNATWQQ